MKKSLLIVAAVCALIALPFISCTKDEFKVGNYSVNVTYHGNGGSFYAEGSTEPQSTYVDCITSGELATVPPFPYKEGYFLVGWYTDSLRMDCLWDFRTPVVKDLDLFAKWSLSPVTVTYDAGYGKFPDGTSILKDTVAAGTTLAPPTSPELQMYKFTAWYKDSTLKAGTEWNFEKDVVSGSTVLYAGYTKKQFKVNTMQLTSQFSNSGQDWENFLLQYKYNKDGNLAATSFFANMALTLGVQASENTSRNVVIVTEKDIIRERARFAYESQWSSFYHLSSNIDKSSIYFGYKDREMDMQIKDSATGALTTIASFYFRDDSFKCASKLEAKAFGWSNAPSGVVADFEYDENDFQKSVSIDYPSGPTIVPITDVTVKDRNYTSFRINTTSLYPSDASSISNLKVEYLYSPNSPLNSSITVLNPIPTALLLTSIANYFVSSSNAPYYSIALALPMLNADFLGEPSNRVPSGIHISCKVLSQEVDLNVSIIPTVDEVTGCVKSLHLKLTDYVEAELNFTYYEE